ncbi:MAG: hypothetical protein HOK20_01300, partial [Alphaproteobacteria bacterium]|nr:hypothetical protein [Alphaproteobacteria bacterium]
MPETQNKNASPPSVLLYVEYLSLLSFFPILKIFLKYGSVSIYFLWFANRGKKMAELLRMIGIVNGQPIKILDPSTNGDSSGALDWDLGFRVLETCRAKLEQVDKITETYFNAEEEEARDIMANNVILVWAESVFWPNMLLVLGDRCAKELGVPSNRVFVASTFASLSKALDINYYPEIKSRLLQQPFKSKSLPFFLWAIYLSFSNLVSKSSKSKSTTGQIGFSACFGLKKNNEGFLNDLFWWREQHIPTNRLNYLFNRPDTLPSLDRTRKADSLGINSVPIDCLNKNKNSTIPISKKSHKPLLSRANDVFFSCRLFLQALFFEEIQKSATAFLIVQYAKATQLASYYRFLNLKGLFDNSHSMPDYFSLAASFNGSVRIGYEVSCLNTLCHVGLRVEPVIFSWGKHSTRVLLGSGTPAKHMLISGCIINDSYDEEAQKSAKDFALKLRSQGAKCILSFFDNSFPPRNIYRKLLEWLIEDPQLGLIIKTKGNVWSSVQENGLDGLVDRAKSTGRIHVLPSSASPADAALVSDFSIGCISYSAIVTSALKGARALYLRYERIEEPQKSYCTLESLGPNRCVFNDFDLMKRAVQGYIANPKSNPELGDLTPVLDEFDPFRDGKAGDR